MDEFKAEREALKQKPFKDKAVYFLDYYKWYVIIAIIAAVLIFTLVRDIVTAKDDALYGVFVNAYDIDDEKSKAFIDDYAAFAGIDLLEYDIIIDSSLRMSDAMDESSMSATQLIMVYSAAQDLDVLSLDADNFSKYANNEYLTDLSTCLSPELMEKYADYLYYIDMAVVESVDDTALVVDENYVVAYPDPTKPEEMERPVPVGLNLKASNRFAGSYMYAHPNAYIGIAANSARQENSVKFIEYLLQ